MTGGLGEKLYRSIPAATKPISCTWAAVAGWRPLASSGRRRDVHLELFSSDDDARTWKRRQPLTLPLQVTGHLTRLADGRVLLSHGNRCWNNYGVDVRLSDDAGSSWSPPFRIADCPRSDCGYPSTVQTADGTAVTAYYTQVSDDYHYEMRVAHWNPSAFTVSGTVQERLRMPSQIEGGLLRRSLWAWGAALSGLAFVVRRNGPRANQGRSAVSTTLPRPCETPRRCCASTAIWASRCGRASGSAPCTSGITRSTSTGRRYGRAGSSRCERRPPCRRAATSASCGTAPSPRCPQCLPALARKSSQARCLGQAVATVAPPKEPASIRETPTGTCLSSSSTRARASGRALWQAQVAIDQQ